MTKLETLQLIATAMANAPGYAMMSESSTKAYVKQGLVVVDPLIEDDDCRIATALTNSGYAFINSNTEAIPASTPVKGNTMFEIKSAPIPQTVRKSGAGRKQKYPFDALEVGQYFFVPATEKQPDPAKSLGSVVTSANKRYAEETGDTKLNRKGEEVPKLAYTRKFIVRPFNEEVDGEYVAGAGVWREK